MYLDYAEDQARRNKPMHMSEWMEKLDAFLRFNEREVLGNPGFVSNESAKEHAFEQYEIFNRRRLTEESENPSGDIDRLLESTSRVKAKLPEPKKRRR